MKTNKGFTLIELLVVIAIIGILSSVVLASLNSARNKGSDAKTKAQLSATRAAAEVFYDNNGQLYTGICSVPANDPSGLGAYLDASNATSWPSGAVPNCQESATEYAMDEVLTGGNYWCIDSKGNSLQEGATLTAGQTVCP